MSCVVVDMVQFNLQFSKIISVLHSLLLMGLFAELMVLLSREKNHHTIINVN